MKKLYLFILFTVSVLLSFSQIHKGSNAEKLIAGADIIRYKEYTKIPTYIKLKNDFKLNIDSAIEYTNKIVKNTKLDFILYNIDNKKNNELTYKYIQTINEYPIEFTTWNIHTKNDIVFAINGDVFDKTNISTDFLISESYALQIALNYINAESYMWEDINMENLLKVFKKDNNATYFPKVEKVIVPNNFDFAKAELKSAYKIDIYSIKPYDRKMVYVDAQTGEIIFDLPLMHVSNAIGTAHTQYSGIRQINTTYTGSTYILKDTTRGNGIHTLNCNNGIEYASATEFTDDDNIWNNVNIQMDEYATDAHFASTSTYDYYYNIHNRNSIDNNGYEIRSYVHFNLIEYGYSSNVNAFWDGNWMTYGDGNLTNGITPLTTIDICAHEITHGLTSFTCDLVYQNEPGALNESFSDIFGTAVEFYAAPEYADWTLGEDIGEIFRSLENPKHYSQPDTYKGEHWVFGTQDNGGVHTNSGPMNYWFYLISNGGTGTNDLGHEYNVTGIGIQNASHIAHRLHTIYLTRNSNYSDAYFYGMIAAKDIYGSCSPEAKAVGDAFYAIGVSEPYINEIHANFNAVNLESCDYPFDVQFINQSYNFDNILWDFGDGNTSTEINPIHTYTNFGSYNVKLIANSEQCGNDSIVKESFIIIDDAIPCVINMIPYENISIESCSGMIYDTGGANDNYTNDSQSTLTIHSPGASQIVLNIIELDIEAGSNGNCNYDYVAFYEGNSTSSPLINSIHYCNNTINPGVITSTGEYVTIELFSDSYENGRGFKISFNCIGGDNSPIPSFNATQTYSCGTNINFIDESLNDPTSWLWDFGDGNTSNEQNPTHKYQSNGYYSVRLTSSNDFGSRSLLKTNYITVLMHNIGDIPNVETCINENFDINLNMNGEVHWFNNIEDNAPIYVGNYWDHPSISENKTYYIKEFIAGEEFNLGSTNNINGGDYYGNVDFIQYLIFDAYMPFILESVSVNAEGDGIRTIALRNAQKEIISLKTIFIPNGISRVSLNMYIPQGTNLQLVGMGVPNLFRTNNLDYIDYPYTIDSVASIKRSSSSAAPTHYYYYFYDWKVKTFSCISTFSSIELVPLVCTEIVSNTYKEISVSPNPGNGIYRILNLEKTCNYKFTISDLSGYTYITDNLKHDLIDITNLAEGTYFLRIYTPEYHKTIKLIYCK